MINPLSVFFILSSVVTFVLGLWVLLVNKKNPIYRSWFIFCSFVALWSLGLGVLTTTRDIKIANIFYFIHYLGAIHIPVAFLYFTRLYFLPSRRTYADVKIGVVLAAFQMFLFLMEYLVGPLTPKWHFSFYTTPGPLYPLFMAYFFYYVLKSFYLMILSCANATPTEFRKKIFLLIATGIGYACGSSAFLLVYFDAIPPYPIYVFLLFPMITTYGIVKHGLLDIEVIVKKTIVFTGLFAMVMAVVGVVSAFFRRYVSVLLGHDEIWSASVSVFLALLLFDPARKLLVEVTDKFLFQKKENIQVTLSRLTDQILTILDLEEVGKKILFTLQESLRIERGAIFLKDDKGSDFVVLNSFGMDVDRWPEEHPVVQHSLSAKQMVNLENLQHLSEIPEKTVHILREIRAHVVLPLFVQGELIALLLLGKKKSDQEFAQNELTYFPVMAGQIAIALSNARLYDILKKSQIDFAQQAKMAALGTLTAGIGHEVKNPLNNISGVAGTFLLGKRRNHYDKKNKDETLEMVADMMERIKLNVARATSIIDRLSMFAKKPKELVIEKINLEEAIRGAISMVQTELDVHHIKLETFYAPNLPRVTADLHAMEEVFLNLIVNARHAMKENGAIQIRTLQHDKEIEVLVQDTGCGIPAENLDKIFDPFFTTKDTTRNTDAEAIKGSGLGLHLVREIVRRYHGKIFVESKIGAGTTFHILLPFVKE